VFTGWQAVGVAALLAKTVGKAVRRARPARGALHHRGVAGDEPSSSSFPSTHTSSAVAFASAASAALPYAAPVLGPLAVLVSWTRPAGGRHYPSDILAGATIGAAAAVAVTVAHHRWHRAPTPTPGTLRTADSGYMSPRISR
jgi:membrane-associated phospholipid phosphatase